MATLASTTLGQLFGSPDIAAEEKKTLVFTDSVQDASHRAAFVERRAYALNLRALVHRALGDEGWCSLDQVGTRIEDAAESPAERYAVLPPDLREHEVFQGYWKKEKPEDRVRRAVAKRMSFAATLEFGLSSRLGRTLELTGTVTAHVHVEEIRRVAESAVAAAARQDVQLALDGAGPERTVPWARGVVERIRTQGGIAHPWLRTFAETDSRFSIWGGRPRREGMPAFPKGRPAPSFPTTARYTEHLDVVTGTRGWYSTWTARALGVPVADASRYVLALLDALVADGALTTLRGVGGSVVWQIPPKRVLLTRTDATPSRPAVRGVRDAVPGAGDRDRRARRRALPSRPLPRQVRGRAARPRLLPRPVPGRPGAPDRRPGAHVAPARGRTGAAGELVQVVRLAGGAQRPRLHPDAGAGHRHRRPVDRRADLAAPVDGVVPAARRARRPAHRERAGGLAAARAAAGAAAADRPADDDRRRGRPARLLPRRHRDPAPPVPRLAGRPARSVGRAEPHAARQGRVRRRPVADVVARPARSPTPGRTPPGTSTRSSAASATRCPRTAQPSCGGGRATASPRTSCRAWNGSCRPR